MDVIVCIMTAVLRSVYPPSRRVYMLAMLYATSCLTSTPVTWSSPSSGRVHERDAVFAALIRLIVETGDCINPIDLVGQY